VHSGGVGDGGGFVAGGPWEERPVVEDKRREERNKREQRRSNAISAQIDELRSLMTATGWAPAKQPNKYSVLNSAADFIRELQVRPLPPPPLPTGPCPEHPTWSTPPDVFLKAPPDDGLQALFFVR
jgi:hypothetical protein